MSENYIKLSRKILEWDWYPDIKTCRLFLHMLLKANWKDASFRGEEIKRGSFVSSASVLSKETGMSESELRTALSHLRKTGEVTCKTTNRYTIYTVNNYARYQTEQKNEKKDKPTRQEEKPERDNGSVEVVIKAWNDLESYGIKPVKKIEKTSKRYQNLQARLESNGLEEVLQAVDNVKKSKYLQGKVKNWKITFDWFVLPNNFTKVFEGQYEDSGQEKKGFNNFDGRNYDMNDLERKLIT